MAEENSPVAPQWNLKPGQYKEGDYFTAANGKTYVYKTSILAGDSPFAGLGTQTPANMFQYSGKFVEVPAIGSTPEPFATPTPGLKRLVNPPADYLSQLQTGLGGNIEAITAISETLNGTGSRITLKGLSEVARPAEGTAAYRYPMAQDDQGGIAQDADYVLFNFYDYKPPYGPQSEAGPTRDYNQSAFYENADASGYKPILLYMPEDISTGFRAQWNGKSTSTLGADALRASSREGLGNKTAAGITAITSLFERSTALAGASALQGALGKLSGDSFSLDDIFGGISGSILNPNTELLFGGVDLRNFSLSFKLVPRSPQEAKQVNFIVKQFKQATLPTREPGKVLGFNGKNDNFGINAGFIGMPKLVRVSFMHGGGEHPVLPRFKMCAITSVDINYTPDGAYATYHEDNGQPVAIGLDLNFQETKICFAEEVLAGEVR